MESLKTFWAAIVIWYTNRIEKSYTTKKENPVKSLLINIGVCAIIPILIIIAAVIVYPKLDGYRIKDYRQYKSRLDKLESETKDNNQRLADALLKSINEIKNPKLTGINFTDTSTSVGSPITGKTVFLIYPSCATKEETSIYFALANWASKQGYRYCLFGKSYASINGPIYWTDGKNSINDVKLEYLLQNIENKTGTTNITSNDSRSKKLISFLENVGSDRTFPPIVSDYITGQLKIQDVQKYRFEVLGTKFWKTIMVTDIKANNFHIEWMGGQNFKTYTKPSNGDAVEVHSTEVNVPPVQQVKEFTKEAVDKVRTTLGI